MRHGKHRHQLGRKKEHRIATMSSLAIALFKHGRIETTLAKAKALRPFAEKIITLACKAAKSETIEAKLHYRRLAISRVRDRAVIKELFDNKAKEFEARAGGYTRIYKIGMRRGDSAEMALIEMIAADDEGYNKRKSSAPVAEKVEVAPEQAVEAS